MVAVVVAVLELDVEFEAAVVGEEVGLVVARVVVVEVDEDELHAAISAAATVTAIRPPANERTFGCSRIGFLGREGCSAGGMLLQRTHDGQGLLGMVTDGQATEPASASWTATPSNTHRSPNSKRSSRVSAAAGLFLPLMFISNVLVLTQGMPTWLRTVADWNPECAVASSCREPFDNPNPSGSSPVWPMQHPELATVLWSVAIIAVFAPLAVRLHGRTARQERSAGEHRPSRKSWSLGGESNS